MQDLGEDLGLDTIEEAARAAMEVEDRPSLVILRTHIAPGSPNKQDSADAHGSPLGEEEVRLTKRAYGWPEEPEFYVPDAALAHFRACIERGERLEAEWSERAAAYGAAHPERLAEFERIVHRRLPRGWDSDVPRSSPVTG